MATTPPNQASGTGTAGNLSADNKQRPVKGKVKPKNRPAGAPTTPGARWNANPHHSLNYADHLANIQAKKQLGTTNLTDPPSAAQAITEANSAADAQFGPQVRAAQQGLANTEPWFQQHLARIAGYAQAAKTAMQPTLDEAGQLADPTTAATTQAAPGLDPNSEAGRASAMAAQGRAALAALGQQALQTNATSTQDTFAGQALMADRELPQAKAYAASQLAGAQSDRGNAVTKFLTDARANAQNYAIAQGTLGANIANSQADADAAAARTTETGRHNRASEQHATDATQAAADKAAAKGHEPNKYGIPADQWNTWSTAHRQREIDKYDDRNKKPPTKAKKFEDTYGTKPVSTVTANNARDDIEEAKSTVRRVIKSNPKMTREQLGDLLLHGQGETRDSAGVKKVKALWASVVLDLQFNNGMISRKTADRLHQSGYTAKQLGLPAAATPAKNPPKPPDFNPGGNLGGLPG